MDCRVKPGNDCVERRNPHCRVMPGSSPGMTLSFWQRLSNDINAAQRYGRSPGEAGASRAQRLERGKPNRPSRHFLHVGAAPSATPAPDIRRQKARRDTRGRSSTRAFQSGPPDPYRACLCPWSPKPQHRFRRAERPQLKNGRTYAARPFAEVRYLLHSHSVQRGRVAPYWTAFRARSPSSGSLIQINERG